MNLTQIGDDQFSKASHNNGMRDNYAMGTKPNKVENKIVLLFENESCQITFSNQLLVLVLVCCFQHSTHNFV